MLIAQQSCGVDMLLQTHTLARIAVLVILAVTTAACELAGGIFKAGIWVGALGVIALVILVAVVIFKFKG